MAEHGRRPALELRARGRRLALLGERDASAGRARLAFRPGYHGRGYATEASRPLLAFAFEVLGLHRVVGRLEPRNPASARVLEKLGMRREAHLVGNEWVKGEWQSEDVYAVLDREWRDGSAGSDPGHTRY